MFHLRRKSLSQSELDEVIKEYQQEYSMSFRSDVLLEVLSQSRIFKQEANGSYRFQYKYIYYYFVAKYIATNLYTSQHEATLRAQIQEMTSRLYVEDYANIIIFLVYLTKDEKTIYQLLADAQSLYSEHKACNLDSDVGFLSQLRSSVIPLKLQDGPAQDHNNEYRRRMDDTNNVLEEGDRDEDEEDTDEGQVDDTLKLNVAFKTLQIMGQILRNFPGALPGTIKLQVATESYLLGLRAFNVLLTFIARDLDDLRQIFSEYLRRETEIRDESELAERTDDFIYLFTLAAAQVFIQRISEAVGSQHLEATYQQIQVPEIPLSIGLIDTAIKLDHFDRFPAEQVIEHYKTWRQNHFARDLLRQLVRMHFYLFPESYKIVHGVCAQLDIKVNDPRILDSGEKKMR